MIETEDPIVLTPAEQRRFKADEARERTRVRRLAEYRGLKMLYAAARWDEARQAAEKGHESQAQVARERGKITRWAERMAESMGELDEISSGTEPPTNWGSNRART
jgi:hypothetical protein